MVNTLNIKTLAKGMRVEDKAKLLFADRNRRGETSGKEGLLTPEEEKALIEDAQELKQIHELNRLNRLYNISCMMVLDIQTAFLNFKLSERVLTTVITGMVLVGESNDSFNSAIYELISDNYDKQQLDNKEYQDKIDIKADEIRQKFGGRGLKTIYDYFDPPHKQDSFFINKHETEISQPNKLLQKAFMRTIDKVKKYKKQVFQWKYVESKAGFDLLGERERKVIDESSKEINNFIQLDEHLGLLKMYVEFMDKGLMKFQNLEEPKFLNAIRDMKRATRLGKKAKKEAQEEVDKAISKY